MGINEISGAFSGFWARATSALNGSLPAAPASPPAGPKAAPDSAHLANKDQYFAGYAMPAPGQATETSLWAPLVITPQDGSQSPGRPDPQGTP